MFHINFRMGPMTGKFDNSHMLQNPKHRVKQNIVLDDKRTTLVLEQLFWDVIGQLAREEGVSVHDICAQIDKTNGAGENLSAAIRVVCMLSCHLQYRYDLSQSGNRDELRTSRAMFPSRFHQALSRISTDQQKKK